MSRSTGSRVWLWVGVGCAALVILAVIAVGVFVANLFRNPEVRSLIGEMTSLDKAEQFVPVIRDAIKKHTAEKGEFPENLEALSPYLAPEEMKAATEVFTYERPEADAPDDQVILQSRKFKMPGGGEAQIIIQKDLQGYIITKSPLEPEVSGWTKPNAPSEG